MQLNHSTVAKLFRLNSEQKISKINKILNVMTSWMLYLYTFDLILPFFSDLRCKKYKNSFEMLNIEHDKIV